MTSSQIRVKGHLDLRWAAWCDGLTIRHEANGETALTGPLPDQAALYRILEQARNRNLALVSGGEVPPTSSDESLPAVLEHQ